MNSKTKLEYLIYSIERKLYNDRRWIFSTFGIISPTDVQVHTATQQDHPEGIPVYVDGFLRVVSESESFNITGYKELVPLFGVQEEVTLPGGVLANAAKPIKTTYGRILVNALLLVFPFGSKIDYINEYISAGKLSDRIGKMLIDDLITVEDIQNYFKQADFASTLTQLSVASATEKSITTDPEIPKRKAELLAKYKDSLDDPTVISKIEQELIAMDRAWIRGDPSEGFYRGKGKAYNISRKKMHVIGGGEASFADENQLDVIENSLAEGWNLNDMPKMANSLRAGAYNRGKDTQLGGTVVKDISRIFQNTNIASDDCGDRVGIPLPVTDDNYQDMVGRYQVGAKAPFDLSKAVGLIGKTIPLRSPMTCKTPNTDYCKICMGDTIANNPTALSMLAVDVGSSFLGLFMAATHGKELLTVQYNFMQELT